MISSPEQASIWLDTNNVPGGISFDISEKTELKLPLSTVVYRDPVSSQIISRVEDDSWKIGPSDQDKINFDKISQKAHVNTIKTIIYLLSFYPTRNSRQIPTPRTLKGYLIALKFISSQIQKILGSDQPYLQFFYDEQLQETLVKEAEKINLQVERLSNQKKMLSKSSSELKPVSNQLSKLNKTGARVFALRILPILKRMQSIGGDRLGFPLKISQPIVSLSQDVNIRKEMNKGQHPVIPPGVYSELFQMSLSAVDEFLNSNFEDSARRLLDYVNDLVNTGGSGNGFKPAANRKGYTTRLAKFLAPKKTAPNLKKRKTYNWDYSKSTLNPTITEDSWFYGCKNRNDVSDRINILRLYAYWLILMQSGMRDHEAMSLPCKPLHPLNSSKDSLAYLLGWTTKYTDGSLGRWILGDAGQKAHETLYRLANFIYEFNVNDKSVKRQYLFINTKLSVGEKGEKLDNQKPIVPTGFTHTTRAKQGQKNKINRVDIPTVSQRDLEFLEKYSLASKVDWHKTALGEPWPLTAHQFRRSFVFYALATGYLTVAGAKRQLQHLSKNITEYYGTQNGDPNLHQYFTDDESREMVDTETSIVDVMRYFETITSGKKLYGAGGLNIEKHLKSVNANTPDERLNYVQENKEKFLKYAREGRFKATETPLGMCLSTIDCDSYALGQTTACLSCMNAIHDPEKVMAAKKILEEQRSQTNDWMELRIIDDQLSDFAKYERPMHEELNHET